MIEPSYYLYYEKDTTCKLEEFNTKEALNIFLASLEDVTYVKIIGGFTLDERGTNG